MVTDQLPEEDAHSSSLVSHALYAPEPFQRPSFLDSTADVVNESASAATVAQTSAAMEAKIQFPHAVRYYGDGDPAEPPFPVLEN